MSRVACIIAVAAIVMTTGPANAQGLLTQEEALRLAFPEPAEIERRTAFLTDDQVRQALSLAGAGVEMRERVVTYYVGILDGSPVGVAYFDVHRVRTLPEVLMIVVTPAARIERIEVLRFAEPREYRAPQAWLEQFGGRPLDENLSERRGIVNITGATLTTRAVTRAVRKVLALHQVISPVVPR